MPTKMLYCQKCGFITEHEVVYSIADNLEAHLCQQCLLSWSQEKADTRAVPKESNSTSKDLQGR